MSQEEAVVCENARAQHQRVHAMIPGAKCRGTGLRAFAVGRSQLERRARRSPSAQRRSGQRFGVLKPHDSRGAAPYSPRAPVAFGACAADAPDAPVMSAIFFFIYKNLRRFFPVDHRAKIGRAMRASACFLQKRLRGKNDRLTEWGEAVIMLYYKGKRTEESRWVIRFIARKGFDTRKPKRFSGAPRILSSG